MKRFSRGLTILSFGLMLMGPDAVPGLGEEKIGPGPVSSPANYPEWDGIMPLLDHETRIYYTWVNGGERVYHAGTQEQLEEYLVLFAATSCATREVRLHPGAGNAESFDHSASFPHAWSLRIDGGLSRGMALAETGTGVLEDFPVVHVYTQAPGIDLGSLRIPGGLAVVGLAEQKERLLAGLAAGDPLIRGQAMMDLGRLDPHDPASARAIQALATDPDGTVRSQVPRALAVMSAAARAGLPGAPPAEADGASMADAAAFRAGADRIEAFVAARRQAAPTNSGSGTTSTRSPSG